MSEVDLDVALREYWRSEEPEEGEIRQPQEDIPSRPEFVDHGKKVIGRKPLADLLDEEFAREVNGAGGSLVLDFFKRLKRSRQVG